MFGLTNDIHYYLYQGDVDMRKGINGLYKLVKNEMRKVPISGDAYIFFSRNRRMVKILKWDGDGFILYYKKLERGTFERLRYNADRRCFNMPWRDFVMMMQGASLEHIRYRSRFEIRDLSI